MKPKKPTKPRNTPSIHEASHRGAVGDFSHVPNRKGMGDGESTCLRCGDPPRHWVGRPHPFRGKLDIRFSPKGKGGAFTAEEVEPESTPGIAITDSSALNQPAAEVGNANGTTTHPAAETRPDAIHRASINDVWAQYYSQYDPTVPSMINVCHAIRWNQPKGYARPTTEPLRKGCGPMPPPILIDSGASCSAVGGKWIESWVNNLTSPERIHIDREFRFGGGSPLKIIGEMNLSIAIP